MDIDNHRLEDDLNALEHRLSAWRPAAGGALDRDRMLYDAGRASAIDGRVRSWRLATAALLLLTVGFGGLLMQQRSLLERERDLLAHERSRRQAMETAIAGRTATPEPSAPDPSPASATTTIEPLSPTSYFVLTARMASDVRDGPSPDLETVPGPHRPSREPAETSPQPGPLRPGDVRRILDL
jgi:hypothetical protein